MRITPASLITFGTGGSAWAEAEVTCEATVTMKANDAMAHRSILMCWFMVDVPFGV
jgi:hypothetical protein